MSQDQPIDPSKNAFQVAMSQKSKIDSTEPETKLWSGGYSAKAMYGTWLFSTIVTIGIIVAVFLVPNLPANAGMIAAAIIVAWWLIAIGIYVYERISVHYELTSQRFVHKRGILVRTTDRIDVVDIDDVTFRQGIIQRMLNVGSIILLSSDRTDPNLVLRGIDEVEKVTAIIDDTRRKERRRRSVHIDNN
jgi:membrane protein YdbS with pleckstrin-like domain